MNKHNVVSLLLALVLLFALALPAFAEDTIKIGGIGVLTGDNAEYGQAVREGVDLYIKQINEKGGVLGKKVEVLWEDTQGTVPNAINAYNKLMEEGIVGIIGAVLSSESKALAEVSADDGIPQITPSSTAYDITTDRPNVFRTCFLDPFQGNVIAKYMSDSGYKKVAVLYDNANEYSKGLYNAFKARCDELGVEIVATESAAYLDKDYKTQLTTIAAAAPEAVFLPYYGIDIAMILAQAKEIGLDVQFCGGDGASDVVEKITDKTLLTNLVYTDHFTVDADSELAKSFVASFEAEYGKLPAISFSATSYDAALVLLSAIEAAGSTDNEAVVAAIKATDLSAVSGKITFDDHNDPIKSAFLLTFNDQGVKQYLTQVDP